MIFTPKPYQRQAIEFLLNHPQAGLFLATGLGKTACFLHAFHELRQKGQASRALIVAKKRIITNTWPAEIQKWGLPLTWAVCSGTPKARQAALSADTDITLISYDNLAWLQSEGRRAHSVWDVLCLDESSMVKNWSALRTKALKKMLRYFTRRYLLTASPAPNDLMDLFSQMYMVDEGESLGRFKYEFEKRFCVLGGWKGKEYVVGPGSKQAIYEAIQPRVLRIPKSAVPLPPLHHVQRLVELPATIRHMYLTFEAELFVKIRSGNILAPNAGIALNKLRQITGGAVYYEPDEPGYDAKQRSFEVLHSAKINALVDLIDDLQGEPLLVAYEFDHERQRIQDRLGNPPHIGGGVSDAQADRTIADWNAGKLPLLLGHPDSIAHGLNLQDAAHNCCFFTLGWNLENHTQFIDRLYRQGQKQPVYVYTLVAQDTVDQAVADVLSVKHATQEDLFEALQRAAHEEG